MGALNVLILSDLLKMNLLKNVRKFIPNILQIKLFILE
nr:MAG TPA: hypothetical protein [Bacteriophage sp.]